MPWSSDIGSLISFDWKQVMEEINSNCPELLDLLVTIGFPKSFQIDAKEDDVGRRIAVCYGILMQSRRKDLSLMQRMLTAVLTEGGASKKVSIVCYKYTSLLVLRLDSLTRN